MNIIQIAGHLGTDPETRFTASGLKVSNLNVAVNIREAGKDVTIWYRVTIWGDRFDKMMPYFKKGSAVIVVGELGSPKIYTDKEGRTKASLEITAEIIRFSPFGKPANSSDQQAGAGAPAGSGSFGQAGQSSQAGFGERSFGAQAPTAGFVAESPAYGNSYAAPYQQSQSAYNQNHHDEEDKVPF